ncbi:hypothetical protein RF11_00580 [Thelohanellus kitauei]|uniref:Uncharacterized protein n=1 Tax=Thelohanellus kitauei TaxID=669202 RepID=A0A0C2N3H6_THEKT|nr:hypothetical protein RF11_00580 [Thelohanellus kitauei]
MYQPQEDTNDSNESTEKDTHTLNSEENTNRLFVVPRAKSPELEFDKSFVEKVIERIETQQTNGNELQNGYSLINLDLMSGSASATQSESDMYSGDEKNHPPIVMISTESQQERTTDALSGQTKENAVSEPTSTPSYIDDDDAEQATAKSKRQISTKGNKSNNEYVFNKFDINNYINNNLLY